MGYLFTRRLFKRHCFTGFPGELASRERDRNPGLFGYYFLFTKISRNCTESVANIVKGISILHKKDKHAKTGTNLVIELLKMNVEYPDLKEIRQKLD